MALSWNEIRNRALEFSKRWENETSEDAEAKPFWIEFLNVFGIDRKRVASFEELVKKLGDKQGFIDLFWKGMLLQPNSLVSVASRRVISACAKRFAPHQMLTRNCSMIAVCSFIATGIPGCRAN